jgi:hypothetical protein
MFELLKKYGTLICHGAHTVADLLEAEGPAIVTALHELGNHAGVAGRVFGVAEEVVHVASELAPAVASASTSAALVSAVAAVDADIAQGAFAMPTPVVPAGDLPRPRFVNPLRQR